jgi:hypothetical protein
MTSDTTCRDLPPEELAEKATGPAPDFDQVLGMPDPLVEPEPSAFDLLLNRKLVEIEAETGLSVADFLHVVSVGRLGDCGPKLASQPKCLKDGGSDGNADFCGLMAQADWRGCAAVNC